MGGDNILYINQPQADGSIRFKNMSSAYKLQKPFYSFSSFFFDYNNDGWEDLFVCGYDIRYQTKVASEYTKELMGSKFDSEHFHLFQNTGKGHFIDVTEQTKLDKVSFGMGLNFGDLNNDGYLDIFVGTGTPDYRSQIPNRAFMNIKGKNFKEVTFNYGLGNIQKGHGIGFGDFDNDGDQDIYMVLGGAFEGDNYFNALYQNNLVTPNNWITLKLEGKQSNSCAIGARIKLSGTNPSGIKKEIYLTVGTGGSFGASSLQQEIGIGDINSISVLEIMWPNKSQSIQLVEGLQVNQVYKIIEGDPNASPLKKNGFEYKTQSHSHTH
jgi:hypothetical protein